MKSSIPNQPGIGTKDGAGAGDHDDPYDYGCSPTAGMPHPFTPLQLAHLLVLRGRWRDGGFKDDRKGLYLLVQTPKVVQIC